jgi:cardiolipin synthase
MRAAFADDVAHSEQITLEQWRQRSFVLYLKEWFSRLWQYWL